MAQAQGIKTYILVDVETTGLPSTNYGETKITEISLISVLRKHLIDCPKDSYPRVVNKITMCFHPAKFISVGAEKITKLNNELLEEHSKFDRSFCEMLISFILRSPQPVCLLAHNGYRFDFPLIQAHTKLLGMPLPECVLCADTLHAFRELKITEQEPPRPIPWSITHPFSPPEAVRQNMGEFNTNHLMVVMEEISMYDKWEGPEDVHMTPERRRSSGASVSRIPHHESLTSENVRKKMEFNSDSPKKSKPSYKLEAVYRHIFNKDIQGIHSAEGDTTALLQIISQIGDPFHDWVEKNNRKLNTILKMW